MEGYVKVNAFKTTAPYTNTIMSVDSAQNLAQLQIGTASAADKAQFALNIGGTVQTLASATALTAGTWYHIAGTYDGAKMRIYINGVLMDSMVATGYVQANGPLYLGRDSVASDSSFFNGSVDELRIWFAARNEAEISANECAVTAWTDSLAAYYTFNDCGTVTPYDNSGNGHDGTTANMTAANWTTPAPCLVTGVPVVTGSNAAKLYPNPVYKGNELQLELPSASNAQCYIYDETGNLIYSKDINQQLSTINTSKFSNGVYFYKVISSEQTYTGRFIVLQ